MSILYAYRIKGSCLFRQSHGSSRFLVITSILKLGMIRKMIMTDLHCGTNKICTPRPTDREQHLNRTYLRQFLRNRNLRRNFWSILIAIPSQTYHIGMLTAEIEILFAMISHPIRTRRWSLCEWRWLLLVDQHGPELFSILKQSSIEVRARAAYIAKCLTCSSLLNDGSKSTPRSRAVELSKPLPLTDEAVSGECSFGSCIVANHATK